LSRGIRGKLGGALVYHGHFLFLYSFDGVAYLAGNIDLLGEVVLELGIDLELNGRTQVLYPHARRGDPGTHVAGCTPFNEHGQPFIGLEPQTGGGALGLPEQVKLFPADLREQKSSDDNRTGNEYDNARDGISEDFQQNVHGQEGFRQNKSFCPAIGGFPLCPFRSVIKADLGRGEWVPRISGYLTGLLLPWC